MFVYRSRFLTRGEVWFDNEPDDKPVDWILYRQRSSPVPHARCRFFFTRLIDLGRSPDELLADMEETTVSKIRQAIEKDKLACERRDGSDARNLDEFETMWNEFAAAKGSAPLNRAWLQELAMAGALDMTAARDVRGALLAVQATYRDKKRAQQLMVVSPYRSNPDIAARRLTNRANCFLHWNAMLRMKEQGIGYFDFGGWYPGTSDIELLGINAFKKSFGGQVVCEYECHRILTLKARLVLTIARILRHARDTRREYRANTQKQTDAANGHKVSPAF